MTVSECGNSSELKARKASILEGWSYQHVPGEGVPPDDRAWEEGVAVHLDASRDDFMLVRVVISFTRIQ